MEVSPDHPEQKSSHSLPWKTRIALSAISAVTTLCRRHDGTINRRLLGLLQFKAPPNPIPINGVKTSDITVDPSRNLWFRLFVPTSTRQPNGVVPVIVFFHGGGFAFLSPDDKAYDAVCRRFARKLPAIVVSVNYRLAPEYRYPAQYEDGFDVLRFLDNINNRKLLPENADLSSCFLAGDSAGGNLAHHVAKRACALKFREVKVIGLVSIQPFFGGEERTESEIKLPRAHLVSTGKTDWAWSIFLPPEESEKWGRDHEAINVSGPRGADIRGLEFPATIVFVGGQDPLKDWQRRYYKWLTKSGKKAYLVEYPNMVHAFYVFPELPESRLLMTEVAEFVRKHGSSSSSVESTAAC